MSANVAPAVIDGFRNDAERKKRLGQYFTGVRLARLLAALSGADAASSVLDPMVGTGDMLLGCLRLGATPAVIGAVEIDPIAYATCRQRLEGAGGHPTVICGSAFSAETMCSLPTTSWDLCITNPPYVRYQSAARATAGAMQLPSALEVRAGLIAAIDEVEALGDEDKEFFRQVARSYSGLADSAVPSWILCAALVRVGGTLAMLVPTTWLSRDYAQPVRYLLTRWFDTRYVVEDADAVWFDDALVRTTLVVATRVERREPELQPTKQEGYIHIQVGRELADERSLVGAAYADSDDPDRAFAADAALWRARRRIPKRIGISGHWVPARYVVRVTGTTGIGSVASAGAQVRRAPTTQIASPDVPLPLASAVGPLRADACLKLEDLGWCVGQGLRTGANQFFYGDAVETRGPDEVVRVSQVLGGGEVPVPRDALETVLRRQAELPDGFAIRAEELRGRVLLLDGYAVTSDVEAARGAYRPLSRELADHVSDSAKVNIGTGGDPKFIPELSAVAPNARRANPNRPSVTARFWYQLPPITDRHRPSLALARVNHGHPRSFLNEGRRAIIDANFSTLWPTAESVIDEFALLAMMNSWWIAAAMEVSCTVLGGGALKVEASHVRRLPIPNTRIATREKLSRLGQQLAVAEPHAAASLLMRINEVVAAELVGLDRASEALRRFQQLATERLVARMR